MRVVLAAMLLAASAFAASYDAKLFAEMRWRTVGPYRGGRARAAVGVPSQPNVFYIGAVNGGVWKTNDYGRTWVPIFDDQPTGSIGAIAVAPSDPNIIYVGSGEGLQRPDLSTGDGVYKSTDGGKTWTHLGLRDSQQIPQIVVDPRDSNRLFVAVLGHPYGANEERGIFRSTDGGQTFQRILYKDANTGGSDLAMDPSDPNILYAAMWESRQGPWENGAWSGTGGGLFKSTDGGATWRQLRPTGDEGVIQANIAIAPSNPRRIYTSIATAQGTGIYRSDDAGENWSRATTDPRPAARIGGGDLSVPTVDPKNADIVYTASTVTWKSTDGGKAWTGIRGAPGGDDYQKVWINPNNLGIILIASDQGAIITVNGGESWSSWYNQPTAAMYHVTADNAFPYRLCGGQQDSGSACVASRGNDGQITMREWRPAGLEEYGYAAPDPLDPDIVYGGKLTRYDRRTGQVVNVSPKPIRPADFRVLRTAPVVFSPVDPHILYFAANTLWKTRDGGNSWQQISPDLTRKTWETPPNVGKYRDAATAKPAQRGVIYSVAPSPLEVNRIWAGTDDGLIHVTVDGGLHWKDVTPPQLVPFAKVAILDAGHFDAGTVYAAINTLRLDDNKPHIYRTHDGGANWKEIVDGISDGPVDAVREDPKTKGLLFAGTERQVYVSFDDGDRWQSLRLNMPASSVRDLIIKDDDLVAATHGRGFWILDDITPLRQLTSAVAESAAFLFRPQTAARVRWNMNTDTPLPPDEPAGQNPPDGAVLDYYLGAEASGPVTLEILDAAGVLVRRYSSEDQAQPIDIQALVVPAYWVRPWLGLSGAPGMHRFLWDMHYAPVPDARPNLPIQAIFRNTVPAPSSPWVMPGNYAVKLTVNGKTYTQPLTVKMDPRVKTPPADLLRQFTVSKQLYDDLTAATKTLDQVRALRQQLGKVRDRAEGAPRDTIAGFDKKTQAIEENAGGIGGALRTLMRLVQNADVTPTTQAVAAAADRRAALAKLMQSWTALKTMDLASLNAQLKLADLPVVTLN
jgi:photosystem II stability/assembly factor-like uncharacterized protein